MSDTYRLKRRATVAALHAEGLTNAQISARIGINEGAVSSYIRKLGLLPNEPPPRKTGISLARAPWEQPTIDRAETAPRGRSYMVSTKRRPVNAVIAAIRAEHRRAVA